MREHTKNGNERGCDTQTQKNRVARRGTRVSLCSIREACTQPKMACHKLQPTISDGLICQRCVFLLYVDLSISCHAHGITIPQPISKRYRWGTGRKAFEGALIQGPSRYVAATGAERMGAFFVEHTYSSEVAPHRFSVLCPL